VWLDGDRVVLFDFDEFSLGDPMEDLASFSIKLEQQPLPADHTAQLVRALLDAYREAAPQRWCATTLAWHRAVQALLQTSRAFIFQVPGWQQELAARLALTEQRAQEAVA
jgi:aminoglycoside phosphotransferase (APT) family kinase protein